MRTALRSGAALLVAVISGGPYVVECSQDQQPMKPKIVTQLGDLTKRQVWKDVRVDLVSPEAPTILRTVNAKAVSYQRTPLTQQFWLAIIPNSHSGFVHLVRGYQTFYVAHGEEMWASLVSVGELVLARSYSKIRMPSGNPEDALESFQREFDEEKLGHADKNRIRVSLRPGVPAQFFLMGSEAGSSGAAFPTVAAVELTNQTLRLDLVSDGNKYSASFWIDLNVQKLTRTVLDGKEVFRAKS